MARTPPHPSQQLGDASLFVCLRSDMMEVYRVVSREEHTPVAMVTDLFCDNYTKEAFQEALRKVGEALEASPD